MNIPKIRKITLNKIKNTHAGILMELTNSASFIGKPSMARSQAKADAVAIMKVTVDVVTSA